MNKSKSESVPKAMQAIFEEIVGLTDAVCKEHLNEEYAQMCRKMAATLCRKRPSPLLTGKAQSWACGILYTIGHVNFLSDSSQKPTMKLEDLSPLFGVGKGTGAGKSKVLRDIFNIRRLDPEWTLPSRMERNPLAWIVQLNGLPVDARVLPRAIQIEAFEKGFIPYLPEPKSD